MILKLSLDLPDDASFVPLTRKFGRGLLEYLKVTPEDIFDVEMIVSELATNVVRHAQSSSGRYQIVLDYFADHVLITVIDAGEGFAFKDVPEVGSARPDTDGGERVGGFGMPILDALTNKIAFERTDPHGTTVRAEKTLHYESQGDNDHAEEMNKEGAKVHIA